LGDVGYFINKNMLYDVAILINLERREDRAKRVIDHLKKRGVQNLLIYPAFDGKLIANIKITPSKRNYFSWTTMNMNVAACAFSHIAGLKMAKSLGYKKVLMLEDDVVLSKDFNQRMEIYEKEVENLDWEHLFIGGAIRRPTEMKKISDHVWTSSFTDCTHAYIVKETGIKKVADEMLKFNTTVDDAVNDIILNKTLRSYTFLPLTAFQIADLSDIDGQFRARIDTMQYYQETL
jgi:GR25 family glycosyltransferase involved in LPS biosynthesis